MPATSMTGDYINKQTNRNEPRQQKSGAKEKFFVFACAYCRIHAAKEKTERHVDVFKSHFSRCRHLRHTECLK